MLSNGRSIAQGHRLIATAPHMCDRYIDAYQLYYLRNQRGVLSARFRRLRNLLFHTRTYEDSYACSERRALWDPELRPHCPTHNRVSNGCTRHADPYLPRRYFGPDSGAHTQALEDPECNADLQSDGHTHEPAYGVYFYASGINIGQKMDEAFHFFFFPRIYQHRHQPPLAMGALCMVSTL